MKKSLPMLIVAVLTLLFATDVNAKTKSGTKSGGITWIGDIPSPATIFNAFCNHKDNTTRAKMESELVNRGYTISPTGRLILEGQVEILSQWFSRIDQHLITIYIADKELREKYYKALAAYLRPKKVVCTWTLTNHRVEFTVDSTRSPSKTKSRRRR